jgi:hypothetical protein
MPTDEAGLSGGQDQGDGGRTTASDTPGGEQNKGVGQDRPTTGQGSTDVNPAAGHLGAAGDPAEGKTDPAATGQGPARGQGS